MTRLSSLGDRLQDEVFTPHPIVPLLRPCEKEAETAQKRSSSVLATEDDVQDPSPLRPTI